MRTLTQTEAAYLAGVLDGEGSITMQRSGRIGTPLIAVDSTDAELLAWIHERCGGWIIFKKRYADHHRQAWIWRVKAQRALRVLEQVMPYLVIERKRQRAQALLDGYDACTPANGRYTPKMREAKLALVERVLSI